MEFFQWSVVKITLVFALVLLYECWPKLAEVFLSGVSRMFHTDIVLLTGRLMRAIRSYDLVCRKRV